MTELNTLIALGVVTAILAIIASVMTLKDMNDKEK